MRKIKEEQETKKMEWLLLPFCFKSFLCLADKVCAGYPPLRWDQASLSKATNPLTSLACLPDNAGTMAGSHFTRAQPHRPPYLNERWGLCGNKEKSHLKDFLPFRVSLIIFNIIQVE